MRINVITIFPEFFTSPLDASLVGKAREEGALDVIVAHLTFVLLVDPGLLI